MHEIVQGITPASRIAYVDNDPLVLAHARALLTSTPGGTCAYIDCDVRDPGRILDQAAEVLDYTRPVALILFGTSFLALNDGTGPVDPRGREEALRIAVEQGSTPYVARTPNQIAGFFDGLELVEPGVVSTSLWRAEASAHAVDATCGLARKP